MIQVWHKEDPSVFFNARCGSLIQFQEERRKKKKKGVGRRIVKGMLRL